MNVAEDKFFDIRNHKPKPGQILSIYRSFSYFVDGWPKRNVIKILLENKAGAETAMKIMRNFICAVESDSIAVPLMMANDLASGMTEDEVAIKEYKFILEKSFWAKREDIPLEDPRWSVIEILNDKNLKKDSTLSGDILA